jgi:uncharacterized membrane protein
MKACPKCETKNQESSQFCKKCGVKLTGSAFEDKKEKVLGEEKVKRSWKVLSLTAVALLVLVVFVYWLVQRGNSVADPKIASQPKVAEKVDYTGQTITMTDVSVSVDNGKISVPVETVLEKRMVRFEYDGNGVKVPLLSYVTQTGKVVTAVSMCEPCRSTRFHIKNKTLICNACGTEWNLETLKGIQGGCLNYPPDVIPSTIVNNQIQIDEKVVAQWKPRA